MLKDFPAEYISIHVPAWGTTTVPPVGIAIFPEFQSTFPRGERLRMRCQEHTLEYYFNPRSRVGNDTTGEVIGKGGLISIHVPAWGTTRSI